MTSSVIPYLKYSVDSFVDNFLFQNGITRPSDQIKDRSNHVFHFFPENGDKILKVARCHIRFSECVFYIVVHFLNYNPYTLGQWFSTFLGWGQIFQKIILGDTFS